MTPDAPLSDGLCAGRTDLNAVFFSPGGNNDTAIISPFDKAVLSKPARAALLELREQHCWRCPSRITCLRTFRDEEFGVFAGMTKHERKKLEALDCGCGAPLDPRDIVQGQRELCPSCQAQRVRRAG